MRIRKVFRSASVFAAVLAVGALVSTSTSASAQTCNVTTWNLTAGQTIDVGSVSVSNDATNIYVTYTLDYQNSTCSDGPVDAEFGNLHVWIGNDLLQLPATNGNAQCPGGVPQPGQFCQADPGHSACADATGLTTYTFTFPIADLNLANYTCGDNLYVFTHAEVNLKNCDGTQSRQETAWGGPTPGTCNRWYFYGSFTPNCNCGGGGGEATCETAYAKGGYVWTTDRRSNPQNLPSLNLTRNRWGWAINLTTPGVTTYDIWAGAGLNNTANGTKVGTLTLNWDGSNVVVTYDLTGPWLLEEVHIYAGDNSPTTIAPGQYGFIDDPVAASTYTTTLPLADTNGVGGVWVVAHGITCTP
jgi:hypothetical protein